LSSRVEPLSGPEPYERPRIERRDAIDVPLIGTTSPPPAQSAAFRPTMVYEPPNIERRESIGDPLIATAIGSGPTG
jgi:hypothetical protein